MKICPACERQNPADALICDSCGERLPIDSGWDKTRIRAPESGGFAPGHSIAGRYEIIKEIGRGGICGGGSCYLELVQRVFSKTGQYRIKRADAAKSGRGKHPEIQNTAQGASDRMQVTNRIQVTIRAAPSTSAKIIGLLASDDEVTVLEPGEKWTKIRTPAGKEGWVMTRFLHSRSLI